jgi:hypothetical protein
MGKKNTATPSLPPFLPPSLPCQGIIQNLISISGRDHNHPTPVRVQPIHARQQLVQRLLHLVITPPQAKGTLLPEGIQLIEEDDAGGLFLRALEEGADTGGASV